ncbi:hypothetical protein RJ639_023655 [Escallonia herrerae]|uniref:non-specific serine/threonine protein kinase n=1 Tax=Escallonia herrerae TaxID=1293975 RepID=A0AA88V1U0_9ASTE|nr:hypothetical protein RJ639_023655 [Escallonia herrerae]
MKLMATVLGLVAKLEALRMAPVIDNIQRYASMKDHGGLKLTRSASKGALGRIELYLVLPLEILFNYIKKVSTILRRTFVKQERKAVPGQTPLAMATKVTPSIITYFNSSNPPWHPTQNQILLSNNSAFAAGFLPLPTTPSLYNFSVWYHNTSALTTAVWYTTSPVNNFTSLVITCSGELHLNSSSGQNLFTPKPGGQANPSQLILGDDGNLKFGSWESIAHTTDAILPNQPINGTTLTSQNGNYTFVNSNKLVFNESLSYYTNDNRFVMLGNDGKVIQENIYEYCLILGTCGANAICMNDGLECVCPPGFRQVPSGGEVTCERKTPLMNPQNTKCLWLNYVNFSGGSHQTNTIARNFTTCQARCMTNPKCLGSGSIQWVWVLCATAGQDIVRVLVIEHQDGDLEERQIKLYVHDQLALDDVPFSGQSPFTTRPIQCNDPEYCDNMRPFTVELISGLVFFWAFLNKYVKYRDMAQTFAMDFLPASGPKRFSYVELKDATDSFSNIIGKGGFDDVYKGELSDHQIVSVKCLKNVTGSDAEFWAEVTIIVRMHHLNLVRLWGFCVEKGQRILVHKYVPNALLDKFLFRAGRARSDDIEQDNGDLGQTPILDWNVRYRITLVVARAIAYLLEECFEWVLHYDIKPQNILIGNDFCPKISDFRLAKLKKKEDMVSMSHIQGTRGYMVPEWVKSDQITPKTNVYRFGMVLLEMVSRVRNFESQGLKMESDDWYFPRWAFNKVFKGMNVEDLLDCQIKHCYDSRLHFDMVDRMVKTVLWCL